MIANKSLNQMAIPLRSIAVGEFSHCECPILAEADMSVTDPKEKLAEANSVPNRRSKPTIYKEVAICSIMVAPCCGCT